MEKDTSHRHVTSSWARAVAVVLIPMPTMLSSVSILNSAICVRNVHSEHVVRTLPPNNRPEIRRGPRSADAS